MSISAQSSDEPATMQIEVAEDGTRFAFDKRNLHDDGIPAYGTTFVTQGYLYAAATLSGINGVLERVPIAASLAK